MLSNSPFSFHRIYRKLQPYAILKPHLQQQKSPVWLNRMFMVYVIPGVIASRFRVGPDNFFRKTTNPRIFPCRISDFEGLYLGNEKEFFKNFFWFFFFDPKSPKITKLQKPLQMTFNFISFLGRRRMWRSLSINFKMLHFLVNIENR